MACLREKLCPQPLDAMSPPGYLPAPEGDVLQGAAADCNSAEETHAWFDSRVAHHSSRKAKKINDQVPCI